MSDLVEKAEKEDRKRYKAKDVIVKQKPSEELEVLPKQLLALARDKRAKAYEVELPSGVGFVVVHSTGFATQGFDPSEMTEILDDDLCRKGR